MICFLVVFYLLAFTSNLKQTSPSCTGMYVYVYDIYVYMLLVLLISLLISSQPIINKQSVIFEIITRDLNRLILSESS